MALAPVSTTERVATLDVLRGLALYGVLTANLLLFYSGIEHAPRGTFQFDSFTGFYFRMFVGSRAISTLTILFGIGFTLQLARAEARGEDVRGVFTRRLLAMFLFGVAHIVLLWWGDILWCYAVTGFALLWFRRTSVRALWIWAVVLSLIPQLIVHLPPVGDAIRSALPQPASQPAFNAELLATYGGTDPIANTWANLRQLVYFVGPIALWFIPWVLGHFLLGMAAGKLRWFEHGGADHRRVFRWMLAIGIVVALIGAAVMLLLKPSRAAMMAMPTAARIGFGLLNELVTLGVVAIYIGATVLLMQRSLPRRVLMLLAPVGRMPLTTYLCQSLFGTFIFYGWGLGWIGQVEPIGCLAIALGIFVVQIVIAHLWLRRFSAGPMEWLWRRIIYRSTLPACEPSSSSISSTTSAPEARSP
jgi:uncharacterized protein